MAHYATDCKQLRTIKGLEFEWAPQNRQPQEYSRNIIGIHSPDSFFLFHSFIFLGASLFGVPILLPLIKSGGVREKGLSVARGVVFVDVSSFGPYGRPSLLSREI